MPSSVLRLWCYRYISGITLDHSIILTWIFDAESQINSWISVLDLPSRLAHRLVTSPLLDLRINRSTTAIRPGTSKMCIIFGSIMVLESLLSMVIPSHRPNHYLLMLQWFIPYEMRCCQCQTTMTSQDMQSHIRDRSRRNNRFIGALSTEWAYTNQPSVQPHFLGLGKWDHGWICPKWCGILSVRYIAKLLSRG